MSKDFKSAVKYTIKQLTPYGLVTWRLRKVHNLWIDWPLSYGFGVRCALTRLLKFSLPFGFVILWRRLRYHVVELGLPIVKTSGPLGGTNKKPRPILNRTPRAVVVVPAYSRVMSAAEKLSFKQTLTVLAHHEIRLACPEGLDTSEYDRIAGRDLPKERFAPDYFSGIDGYNRLMTDVQFYNRFAAFDYILICQLDAWVFRDELLDWCSKGYDYIGAPWFEDYLDHEKKAHLWAVGDGGFSLRRVDTFKRITRNGVPAEIMRRLRINEDYCFALMLGEIGCALSVPSVDEAMYFAFEHSPAYLFEMSGRRLPFGCHAWEHIQFFSFYADKIPFRPIKPSGTKLSVITVCYNDLTGLKRTADSVLCQNWRDFEWIIIDGGSTDGSREYIENTLAPFASYWCSEPDGGVYFGMNKGIARATGEYICFMNSGDCFNDYRVLKQVFSTDSKADVIYGNAFFVSHTNRICISYPDYLPNNFFLYDNICHQAMFIRRLALGTGYDTQYRLLADWAKSIEFQSQRRSFRHLPVTVCAFDCVDGISTTNKLLDVNEKNRLGIQAGAFVPTPRRFLTDNEDCSHGNVKDVKAPIEVCSPTMRKVSWRGSSNGLSIGRVAVFATYTHNGRIYERDILLLEGLRKHVDAIVVVGDALLEPGEEEKLKTYAAAIHFERHREYDLGSYRRGYEIARDMGLLAEHSELILMNNSCYGWCYPLSSVLDEMAHRTCDFWGLTSNEWHDVRHIQSYFYCFRPQLVANGVVGEFLATIHGQKTYLEVIEGYELAFTRFLQDRGYKWDSFVPFGLLRYDPNLYPITLMQYYHMPLIKVKAMHGHCLEDVPRIWESIEGLNPALYQVMKHEANFFDVPFSVTDVPSEVSLLEEQPYLSHYQEDEAFEKLPSDICTIAFYLPQYHTFPENDEWWGAGFTEWTNTRKAKPRFPGHYQPRTPHSDIGYYDLSDVSVMAWQARLAKAHGINCFCFYYYWFDGKQLMNKPIDQFLAHKEIDQKFCLCWANENWTRTWDGQESSVLIHQDYRPDNDVRFIADLKKYLVDERYLRCNGKPVIIVYRTKSIPHHERMFRTWREWCCKNGVGEIAIWSCRSFIKDNEFNPPPEVDREVEFPPHMITGLKLIPASRLSAYDDDGYYFDYTKIIQDVEKGQTMADRSPYPYYRCAMLGWDNSCRRETGYSVWQYFSLARYHSWLTKNIEYTRKNFQDNERFIFINAWNEWAEGTYLEPDERYGYAAINTTTRALCGLLPKPEYSVLSPGYDDMPSPGKILIHLHLFYADLAEEFIFRLNCMPFVYDLVVTTDTKEKRRCLQEAIKQLPLEKCEKLEILVVENRGRDLAPFFAACRERILNYDFVCHVHTKKALTSDIGNEWREFLLDQLLGSTANIKGIFRRFVRDAKLGLFYPPPYPSLRPFMNWEQNRQRCEQLMQAIGLSVELPEMPEFPAGQMFWARTKAIAPIFAKGIIKQRAFELEKGQVFDTLAHAIERLWCYIVEGCGYTSLKGIFPKKKSTIAAPKVRRLSLFVWHENDGKVSEADRYLLKTLSEESDIVLIANGEIDEESRRAVEPLVEKIISRRNVGYDFGAWRDALLEVNLDDYEELVLLNNSVIGPFCPFAEIFAKMQSKAVDFWGMSAFPETRNSRREEAKSLPENTIPRHIQSYFLVFRRKAFSSSAFKEFWKGVKDETSLLDVVAYYETQLSNVLERAGLSSDVYLRMSEHMQKNNQENPNWNAIYCRPQDFIALGFPFLKKNICYYMSQSAIDETIHLVSQLSDYPVDIIHITEKRRAIYVENAAAKVEESAKRDPHEEVRRRVFDKNVPGWQRLKGLEIGALCNPLLTKEEADITYYDIDSRETLENRFAEFYPGKTFVDVDIVAGNRRFDDALGDRKFDFIIANHVIEHIPDFIGYFETMYNHLNEGGKIFMAVPDRRFTFDVRRPDTSAGHMVVDHEDGDNVDAAEHVLDAHIYHEQKPNVYWEDMMKSRYDFIHHHHVFCHETFVERIIRPLARMRYLPFSLVTCHYEDACGIEFLTVFEKAADREKISILGERIELQEKCGT